MVNLSRLSTTGLAHRCRRETERYFNSKKHNPAYCFELFRKALQRKDERAWELIFEIYERLILSWIWNHPAFADCGEEDRYFLNRAFERFWGALTPDKFDASASLAELLNYLKLCVSSAIHDHLRRKGPHTLPEDHFRYMADRSNAEKEVLDRVGNQDLWEIIKRKTKNKKERQFVFAYFTLGLTPRDIYAEYPDVFKNVKEVYRTYENLMGRWRRDPDLRAFWDRND